MGLRARRHPVARGTEGEDPRRVPVKQASDCYKPTMKKITRFINYLRKKGGEARLGVKALAKMGFPDHNARKHSGDVGGCGDCPEVQGLLSGAGAGLKIPAYERDDDLVRVVGKEVEFGVRRPIFGIPR